MSNHPVVKLTEELINCQSITPNDAGCQQLIADRLTAAGFKCEQMKFGDVDNLWARIGTNSPLLVFAGHTDVVPPGEKIDWTSPPFRATICDNNIYGRGAVDMKGALAAMIIATEEVIKKGFNGSIGFLITSDEEGPGINGTVKVINELIKRGEEINFCIIGEPSSKDKIGDQIRIGRRGSLHGKLTVNGKQGHVAHPHLADNAIHKSLQALADLCKQKWDDGNSDFPPTSFQITNTNSGTGSLNVIPAHLDASFNFRFATCSTEEDLKTKTEKLLKQHHLDYELTWTLGGQPFLTRKGDLMAAAKTAVKEVCGIEPEFNCGGGTSDGRFIAKTGAEMLEIGCIHKTAHQTDEHEAIENLKLLTQLYQAILEKILQ